MEFPVLNLMNKYIVRSFLIIVIILIFFSGCTKNNDLLELKRNVEKQNPNVVDINKLMNLIGSINYIDETLLNGKEIEEPQVINKYNVPEKVSQIATVKFVEPELTLEFYKINYLKLKLEYLKGNIIKTEYNKQLSDLKERYKEDRVKIINQINEYIIDANKGSVSK
jgi:hypothetical protein